MYNVNKVNIKNQINSFILNLFMLPSYITMLIMLPAIKHIVKIKNISFIIKLFLKEADSISVFFISIIGPSSRKAVIPPLVNCPTKVLAIKASASEQRDIKKAKSIIAAMEYTGCCPTISTCSLDITV
jgi:hypothetical protein